MQHKLIMTWDITQGKEQEYFDFLIHTFVPRMNQLGFDLTDAWATIYGDEPQVMVTAILAIVPPILRGEYIQLLEKAHTNDAPFEDFIADRVIETQKDIMRMLA